MRELSNLIEELGVTVTDTEFISSERDGEMILRYKIQKPNEILTIEVIEAVLCHNTVRRVYEE